MKRNIAIDTLRGIACILLVSYHVVGANQLQGLKLNEGFYKELNEILIYLRMPLFTFLSGIVYAYHPFSGQSKKYIVGKFKRLIIPMLIVGTTFSIIQTLTPGTNANVENWYLLHIKPVGHFWFLEAIFIIFLLMIPLEKLNVFSSVFKTGCLLLISLILYLSDLKIGYFAITGTLYLFPYFILGVTLVRLKIDTKLRLKFGALMIIFAITLLYILKTSYLILPDKMTLIGFFLGASSCLGLFSIGYRNSFLAKIGVYSYSIFLYHVFFTAGSRILFNKLGVDSINILFFLGLILGILGPVIIELISIKNKHSRLLFLGSTK
ncbi:acyltransferase family protein [Pseudocolwellia sp. HL-MZ19]|uniref:acyltransferase family protein n=1 Tax=Pseudocolwellia sp. HL-MZ19 TaxID=3400846 RepID=UPI003CE8ED0F